MPFSRRPAGPAQAGGDSAEARPQGPSRQPYMETMRALRLCFSSFGNTHTRPSSQKTVIAQSCEPLCLLAEALCSAPRWRLVIFTMAVLIQGLLHRPPCGSPTSATRQDVISKRTWKLRLRANCKLVIEGLAVQTPAPLICTLKCPWARQ